MTFSFVAQTGRPRHNSMAAAFAHLGALGLFLFAVLDSSPIPTFGGTDILTVILAATRPHPWWEFAAAATAGSVVGAYFTFRLGRRAGRAYVHSKFGAGRGQRFFAFYDKWGTGALVASTAVPFPFPTSIFFAAAGASNHYSSRQFLSMVAACRGVRYCALAWIAHVYGRHMVRILRHPAQYWHWLLLFAAIFILIIGAGIFVRRQFSEARVKDGRTAVRV